MPNTYYSISDDYVRGLRWFDRGMEHKNEKYMETAASLWEPLAEKGDCDAEYRLGLLYFMGLGKPQSFERAYELWEKAASANQQRAQWALGDLSFQEEESVLHHCKKTPNCNINKNLGDALFWYKLMEKAAKYDGEQEYVANILAKVTSEMNANQIQEVEIKVAEWKPIPKDCEPRNLW